MKKNVFLLIVAICMMGSFSLMAQETEKKKEIKDWMHAVAYKKDGTTFEGYLKNITPALYGSYHLPDASDSTMIFTKGNKLFERTTRIPNSEIDSMVTWYDDKPDLKFKWESRPANFAFGGSKPFVMEHPVMLLLLYKGEKVRGYLSSHPLYGFKYFFMLDDMPYAMAFMKPFQKFNERRRKTLLETFYMYPEMEAYIKTLTKEEVKGNPFCVLKKLDEILLINN